LRAFSALLRRFSPGAAAAAYAAYAASSPSSTYFFSLIIADFGRADVAKGRPDEKLFNDGFIKSLINFLFSSRGCEIYVLLAATLSPRLFVCIEHFNWDADITLGNNLSILREVGGGLRALGVLYCINVLRKKLVYLPRVGEDYCTRILLQLLFE
jgi:hypothetical protein